MIDYSSTLTLESTVTPGVKFTLRKMSDSRRAELNLKTADSNQRIREWVREIERVSAQPQETRDIVRIAELNEKLHHEVTSNINPAHILWGLKSIEGLNIDGEPATPQTLLDAGNSDLTAEIYLHIKAVMSMSEAELKNYVLPSTSGAGADGSVKNLTVTSANAVVSSEQETALDTSQNL